jgi:EamA-like transporter family.
MRLTSGFRDLMIASLLWGTIGIAVQLAYRDGGSSYGIVFYRSLFSAILSIFITGKSKLLTVKAVALGVIAGIFYEIYAFTIIYDGAPLSSFLLYTAPLFVSIFAFSLFGEKITVTKLLASLLVVGSLYLSYLGTPSILQVLWGVASGASYAALISVSKYLQTKQVSDWDLVGAQSLWSLIPVGLAVPFFREGLFSLGSIWGGAFLCIIGTILPYYFFYRGVRVMDSTIATVISALEPVFTTLLAYPILGQYLTPPEILGAILILVSSIWLGIDRRT